MIKIENVSTFGWEPAIRGARNPMNSWDKSDSLFFEYYDETDSTAVCHDICKHMSKIDTWSESISWTEHGVKIGPNDLKLLSNLSKAGSDEAKFRRMIVVYVDITAPMYWWKEADTYKVGTVRNSCSTMHKIHAKEFTLEDFSTEHLIDEFHYTWIGEGDDEEITVDYLDDYCLLDPGTHPGANDNPYSPYYNGESTPCDILKYTIAMLNRARELFLKTHDKKYWWQMIQLLPSSYNQRATLMLNYEVLANMYHARKYHKLDEWHDFCAWIETLPYAKELIIGFQMRADIYEPTILPKYRFKVKVCAEKDGVIELRRGVPDLYLGDGVDWAQVRIQVDQDHYVKGMAMYKDDMPEDCDVVVNVRDKNEAFKDLDYKCAFSGYSYQKLKQIFYKDPCTGDFKLSPINIVSDSFDWAEWSRSLPNTFLSKENRDRRMKEADELDRMANELGGKL